VCILSIGKGVGSIEGRRVSCGGCLHSERRSVGRGKALSQQAAGRTISARLREAISLLASAGTGCSARRRANAAWKPPRLHHVVSVDFEGAAGEARKRARQRPITDSHFCRKEKSRTEAKESRRATHRIGRAISKPEMVRCGVCRPEGRK
jgi:hypothetical protein